jgi:hypothetical protein
MRATHLPSALDVDDSQCGNFKQSMGLLLRSAHVVQERFSVDDKSPSHSPNAPSAPSEPKIPDYGLAGSNSRMVITGLSTFPDPDGLKTSGGNALADDPQEIVRSSPFMETHPFGLCQTW